MEYCKHINVVTINTSRYTIPQGWTVLSEQKDIDMSDYLDGEDNKMRCVDCGERLS